MRHPLIIAATLLATPLLAQQAANTVSPGMSKTQVIAALGTPVTSRTADSLTYVFYKNTCGKTCGMNDLVVLRGDSVVDAIFRSPDRHYTGKSSSPAPIPPSIAARRRADGTLAPERPAKKKATAPSPEAVKKAAALLAKKPAPAPVKKSEPPRKPAEPAKKAAEPAKKPAVAPAKAAEPPARTAPMKPGAANDVHPSIPVKPPALKPAPETKPNPKTP